MFEIRECRDYAIAKELFVEYSKLKGAEQCFVSFEKELENIELIYPDGQILLAYEGENAVGCIAVKELDQEKCELKRLYIKKEYRGKGYSKALFENILIKAQALGYKEAIIVTIPEVMEIGYKMYLSYGFKEVSKSEGQAVVLTKMLKGLPRGQAPW